MHNCIVYYNSITKNHGQLNKVVKFIYYSILSKLLFFTRKMIKREDE